MFGNKKPELPPRPGIPTPEQIQEDLDCARFDDVAFKILTRDKGTNGVPQSDSEDIYKKLTTFLTVKQQLKVLEISVREISHQLQCENEGISRIAENIEEQAKIALLM